MWFIKPKIPSFIWRLKQPNSEQPDTLLPSWIQSEFAKRTELRKRIQENMPYEFDSWAKLANFKSIAFLGTSFQMTNQWLNRLAVHKCVEYRHPFFDRRLIEFMLRVPPKQLWQKGLSKYLLRQSLAGKLPEPIRLRVDKTYYSDVFNYCLRVKDAGHISRLLKDPITAKLGFVDKQEIQRVYHAYLNSQLGAQTAYNLMQLVNLEYWLSHHHKFLN
jgi:asparagine synthase (glutamine-hydrolysing)